MMLTGFAAREALHIAAYSHLIETLGLPETTYNEFLEYQAMKDKHDYVLDISSKNSIFAGPNNIAYGATKADQAHQVRLLAAELGAHQIRVNGVNPDGVVRGSGIFSSGWGAERAKVYGFEESKLGEFYAQRTILKKEVLPEHIAAGVFAIVGGELPLTTGLHIPIDGGNSSAFFH